MLFELVEYDGWVVGLALRSLEGLPLPCPIPDTHPFTDGVRKLHSAQSPNLELELAVIRYAEGLDGILKSVRMLADLEGVTIILTSWRPGLRKVSLARLFCEQAGMSLSQAKAAVDALIEGNAIAIPMHDRAAAEALLESAIELGAVGAIRATVSE